MSSDTSHAQFLYSDNTSCIYWSHLGLKKRPTNSLLITKNSHALLLYRICYTDSIGVQEDQYPPNIAVKVNQSYCHVPVSCFSFLTQPSPCRKQTLRDLGCSSGLEKYFSPTLRLTFCFPVLSLTHFFELWRILSLLQALVLLSFYSVLLYFLFCLMQTNIHYCICLCLLL